MKIKTSELIGVQLDWAVAKCLGYPWYSGQVIWRPTFNWSQAGPIIEQEKLHIAEARGCWQSAMSDYLPRFYEGPTPLVAAMRCYVASKLGNEVEIPEELK